MQEKNVDGRDKPGHDGEEARVSAAMKTGNNSAYGGLALA
jgi:hypothetical protein